MSNRLVWARDGAGWPNSAFSRFVPAAGLTWHVQVMGSGPVALLLHGTGASTHSWRALVPLLTPHLTLVMPDLPGHGFSSTPPSGRLSLPGMARGVAGLLAALGMAPALAVGHSAGAAVAARMSLDGRIAPRGLVSLNGAFVPLTGVPGQVFAPLARLLARTPLLPELFAWRASGQGVVERLIRDTGSTLDPEGMALYGRLVRDPKHAAAALGMMAAWDLGPLLRDLPRLAPALLLVVGGNDRTVPPADAQRLARLIPGAQVVTLPGLGHLAHEERPAETAALILRHAGSCGVLA
jgi:magnesium chelatase accessory protein